MNAFVRGGEIFKSIAFSVELIEAEVQPSWDWIALQCLNILQIIIFSFISRGEGNRKKMWVFFWLWDFFCPHWCETMVEDGSVLLHFGSIDEMIGGFDLCVVQ